jgi:nitroreductase
VAGLSIVEVLKSVARILVARPRLPRSLQDNEMLRTIYERRSVRRFRDDAIPDDVWEAILEAGRLAPSTVNLQTWSFVEFTQDGWRDCFARPLPFGASRAVIVLADAHRARRVVEGFPYSPLCEYTVGVMNASLAAMNMTLAAEALGLGSVMLSETGRSGFYDARYLAEQLALPAGVVPLMSVVFGWPRGTPPAMPPKLSRAAVAFPPPYRETRAEELDAWYRQMRAGYAVSNLGRSFASQVAHYNRRLAEAERDLADRVYYRSEQGGTDSPDDAPRAGHRDRERHDGERRDGERHDGERPAGGGEP